MDANVVGRLAQANVLVVGDVMLDRFIEGEMTWVSREAPVPVLKFGSSRAYPGGASNVGAALRRRSGDDLRRGQAGGAHPRRETGHAVQGADYAGQQIPGQAFVEANGGSVTLLPLLEGYSTTSTVKKAREGKA